MDPPSSEITKSGATITFGPFERIKPLTVDSAPPPTAQVHHTHEHPIVALVSLDRHVEVSHWGDSLSFKDNVWLRNDGPALKGHFSRVDHQVGTFYGGRGRNLVLDFGLQLPPRARDAYFVDQIGNVSTSNFRSGAASLGREQDVETPSHSLPAHSASLLQLQPRYPLLGGWNYTFTIGWDLPLGPGGWGKSLGAGKYSVAVPFWNAFPSSGGGPGGSVPAKRVETRIVLPEGAEVLSVHLPFEDDDAAEGAATVRYETHTTYLDTVGRASVVVSKGRVSHRHAGNIYVVYRLSGWQHVRKIGAVAGVAAALFAGTMGVRRVGGKKV